MPLNAQESEEKFLKETQKEYSQLEKISGGEMFEDYYKDRKKEKENEFIKSEYNSFLERLIAYLGRFFNLLLGR